jgi:hypothetical protein
MAGTSAYKTSRFAPARGFWLAEPNGAAFSPGSRAAAGNKMVMKKSVSIVILLTLILLTAGFGQQPAKLDTTSFVAMGEGLAAGMGNYGLHESIQRYSFPALIAQQMKTAFAQPLIEGPGFGDLLGIPTLPVRIPTYPATQVRIYPAQPNPNDDAPTLFVFNASVPNMRVADSVSLRPRSPLIHRDNMQQTVVNMILGFPALILDKDVPLWSQFEYVQAMNPTVVLVELGYFEALEAAVYADPSKIPDAAAFRTTYSNIVKGLRGLQAQVILTTIPDPGDTAYFSTTTSALQILRVTPFVLLAGYGIKPEDYVTRNGLSAVGNQLFRKQIGPVPAGSFANQALLNNIRTRVNALNTEINNIAKDTGAVVYDLNAFFHRVRTSGIRAGSRTLTADYFGGFYTLDGYYPGPTGHALIANDLLAFINKTYNQSFSPVDLTPVMNTDATLQHKITQGSVFNPTGNSGAVTGIEPEQVQEQ